MNEAIWYLISDVVYKVMGILLTMHLIVSILMMILGSHRGDRSKAFCNQGVFSQPLLRDEE